MSSNKENNISTTALRLCVQIQIILIITVFLLQVEGQHDNMMSTMPPMHVTQDGRNRFTYPTTRKRLRRKTTEAKVDLEEECDYVAYYCLRSYRTGKICGRTVYYQYYDFQNYCMMDYVNCMERYDVWQIAHMGECFEVTPIKDYMKYEYMDDHFLDSYYVIQH